jgi:AcrR family transcriptional regulator
MPKKNTKERMMDAALELFSKKGYDATGVDEIAESVGVKGPNLYTYFKGKQALLEEIMERVDAEYNRGMGIEADMARSISTWSELEEFSLHQFTFTINNQKVRKIRRITTIEQYRNSLVAEKHTQHQIVDLTNLYADIFTRLMKEGIIIEDDPKLMAFEYVSPISLLVEICDRQPEKIPKATEIAKRHFTMFGKKYSKNK